MSKEQSTLADDLKHDARVQRALKGTSGQSAQATLIRMITDHMQLRDREYGRGYLQATADLFLVMAEVTEPDQILTIVKRFDAFVHQERIREAARSK